MAVPFSFANPDVFEMADYPLNVFVFILTPLSFWYCLPNLPGILGCVCHFWKSAQCSIAASGTYDVPVFAGVALGVQFGLAYAYVVEPSEIIGGPLLALEPEGVVSAFVFAGYGSDVVGERCCWEQRGHAALWERVNAGVARA